MRYDGVEKKILEKMCQNLVARESELMQLIQNDTNNPKEMVDILTKSLISKGLITPIYASETTFAITQKGIKYTK